MAMGTFFHSPDHKEAKQGESSCLFSMVSSEQRTAFSASMRDKKHGNPQINHLASTTTWNVAQIAISKNLKYTNLIIMLLLKSRDKLSYEKYEQVIWLCHTICIFLGTINKKDPQWDELSLYVWPERRHFSEDSCLHCSHQDNGSSGCGAPMVTFPPGLHKLLLFPGTTLLAEEGPRPVRGGGRLRAAPTVAMIAAAACDPAGSVLFEYWFATSYRLGLCCAC